MKIYVRFVVDCGTIAFQIVSFYLQNVQLLPYSSIDSTLQLLLRTRPNSKPLQLAIQSQERLYRRRSIKHFPEGFTRTDNGAHIEILSQMSLTKNPVIFWWLGKLDFACLGFLQDLKVKILPIGCKPKPQGRGAK